MTPRSYLVKQADVFYFRRRIPQDIVNRLGTREIYHSLRTTSVRIARRRLLRLFHGTEILFAMARNATVSDDELAEAAECYLRQRGFYERIEALSPQQLRQMPPPTILRDEVKNLAPTFPFSHTPTPAEINARYKGLLQIVLEGFYSATGFIHPEATDVDGVIRDLGIEPQRVINLVDQEASRAVREQLAKSTYVDSGSAKLPRAKSGARFSKLVSEFIDWRPGRKKKHGRSKCQKTPWQPQTEAQARTTYRLFEQIMTDPIIADIGKREVEQFRAKLEELPYSHGKTNGKIQIKRTITQELKRRKEKKFAQSRPAP